MSLSKVLAKMHTKPISTIWSLCSALRTNHVYARLTALLTSQLRLRNAHVHISVLIAALAMPMQHAYASDLAKLDKAGRQIAEKPCASPKFNIKTVKNIHDATVTDRYTTQTCPGASSVTIRSNMSHYKYVLPLFAKVSKPDARMAVAFQVGVPLISIKNQLGAPNVEKANAITYLLPSETLEEQVTFNHDGTHVISIEWVWYFDD